MELGERWGRIKWKKAVAFLKKSAKKLFGSLVPLAHTRHCERSEAIQNQT